MDIQKVLKNKRMMRSITSLEPEEFEQMVISSEREWRGQNSRNTFEGTARQRKGGAGCKGRLNDMREKVFFILMYFKLYPIQEAMAFFWGNGPRTSMSLDPSIDTGDTEGFGKRTPTSGAATKKLHAILQECPELKFI